MEISALFQDLIKDIISQISLNSTRELNPGDLLTARVKTVDGENVLLRAFGMDIPAKALIPLEVGETITFQYQGIQNGKVFFRFVDNNLPQKEPEFVAKVLQSFDLPDTAPNREIVKQIISQQLPLDKKEVIQFGNMVKNFKLPMEDIEAALFLSRQNMPPTSENINLLKDLQSEELNIFQGLDKLENLVSNTTKLPSELKDEIMLLLNKVTSSEVFPQDSGKVILNKITQAPSFIFNQVQEQQITATSGQNDTPSLPANTSEIIITGDQETSKEQEATTVGQNNQAFTTKPGVTTEPRQVIFTSHESETSEQTIPVNRENLLNRLEFLAVKSIGDHEKLNTFLKNIRVALQPRKEEIQDLINKISNKLDATKPEEQTIKEVLKDISNRFDFVDHLVQKAPADNNQQIVFYSQVLLKDNNNHQTPMTITIKQPKDQGDKKINFDNCTLAISLQTENLSLVKANVKKSARQLTCQLLVNNENAKNVLEPFLPELAVALEKLNFSVTIKPVMIETLAKKGKMPVEEDLSSNLFNIDIRI